MMKVSIIQDNLKDNALGEADDAPLLVPPRHSLAYLCD